MLAKAVDHGEANDGNKKNQDSTEVGNTGLQRLESFLPGCNRQHCMQDENVGDENKDGIQQQGAYHQGQGIEAVEANVRAGKPEQVLVQAERVREDVRAAVMEELQTNDDRKNGESASHQNGHHELNDSTICQDGCISQRIADCCKAIKGHGKKDSRLCAGESMDKISLGYAGIQTNLLAEPPQDAQHGVHCGQSHAQVTPC